MRIVPICRGSVSWWEGRVALTDGQWAALEPLVEACRPKGKTPPRHLRRIDRVRGPPVAVA